MKPKHNPYAIHHKDVKPEDEKAFGEQMAIDGLPVSNSRYWYIPGIRMGYTNYIKRQKMVELITGKSTQTKHG